MALDKLRISESDAPTIPKHVYDIIERIVEHPNVHGVMYFRGNHVEMCTVPKHYSVRFSTFLPLMSNAVHFAVTEVDVTDELMTYRIETKAYEIIVAGDSCNKQSQSNNRSNYG
ncbi:uncharacterized protein LOC113231126 isoform X2 [Hyposmocoma kahamanoa]|uniref:uncharacterized protein LOC113231126 isoform X2 n=1 Tax=Hyposmocoma kahamanoa TaxID=1477025 RepID=UPI000E6D8A71|nr:uncharacterized protein LOC113231126 isoform X2 [Hyposmocoma kahamanoa]